jgi:hypothetical protein
MSQDDRQDDRYGLVSRAIQSAIDSGHEPASHIVNYIFFEEEDPARLVIYLAYEDTRSLIAAHDSGETEQLRKSVLKALDDEGYPPWPGRINFVSEEEIDKAGGPWKYFQ